MDKLKMQTINKVDENVERIAALFPNCVTESIGADGKPMRVVDFDLLRQELSDFAVEGQEERYQFTWADKKKSILLANSPISKTLRPCREESVNFDTTKNLYIEGDNLDVLKLLQETYMGKVKMIYIDPPYNTGNDFVYEDDFAISAEEYFERSGASDEDGNRLFQNNDSNGRFHTDWLNMIYPRLKLARDLLTDDGVICVSIDDNEAENLKKVCNEIFGASNFIAQLIWKSKSGGANDSRFFAVDHEYIIIFAKKAESFKLNIDTEATVTTSYNQLDEKGRYSLDRLDKQSIRYSPSLDYEIKDSQGKSYFPQHKDKNNPNATWRWGKETVRQRFDELVFKDGNVYTKNYEKDGAIARSLLLEDRFGRTRTGKTDVYELFDQNLFSNPKPYKLVRFLAMIMTSAQDTILDFFSGSATTAQAIIQLNAENKSNRKFILAQLPEETPENSEELKAGYKNICEIGKERIRRAGRKIADENQMTAPNLDIGFRVLKVDSSNMKPVFYNPNAVEQSLISQFEDNIKDDRTPEDLLFQVMLDMGVDLSSTIMVEILGGKKVFTVGGDNLICCFDKDITKDAVTEIAKRKPLYSVFRDSSFSRDDVMVSFDQIFETYSPTTIRKVI